MNDKRAYWMKHYQDYQSSGLSVPKWCEKKGVPANTLRYWIKKFNKEKKQENPQKTQWASIVPAPSVIEQYQHLKVTIGHSTIEVPKGFDPTTFETVTRILKEQC